MCSSSQRETPYHRATHPWPLPRPLESMNPCPAYTCPSQACPRNGIGRFAALGLAPLTKHHVFRAHPHCRVRVVSLFTAEWYPLWPVSAHYSTAEGPLVAVHRAPRIVMHMFVCAHVLTSSGSRLRGNTGSWGRDCLLFSVASVPRGRASLFTVVLARASASQRCFSHFLWSLRSLSMDHLLLPWLCLQGLQ